MPAEIREYFQLLDKHLTQPTRLVVIGGAAVALGWDERHVTPDVDLFNQPGAHFLSVVDACKNAPGAIPIGPVGIASPPYNFEDRLLPVECEGLTQLHIFIPEAHDLALMKIVRGEAHDFDAIEDIHRIEPLSLDTLIERYHETLSTLIGPQSRFKVSFLALVARLFGEVKAEESLARLANGP